METISPNSYSAATFAYFLLLCLSIIRFNKNTFSIPIIITLVFSLLWSTSIVFILQNNKYNIEDAFSFEIFRNLAWYFFLSVLLSKQQFNSKYYLLRHSWQVPLITLTGLVIILLDGYSEVFFKIQQSIGFDLRFFLYLSFAVLGLTLVEQLYRNALQEQRRSIKFICLALASLFIYDFILYSKSLLFFALDLHLWEARGIINALIVPLLVISFNRLSKEQIKVQVSNKVILHTSVLFGASLYLLLMSLSGYYIKLYGGSWGVIAQISFIFLALVLLLIFFVSGKIRAFTKVYFSKHIFQHKYDYRDEWIRLSKSIAELNSFDDLSNFIINTMSEFVDSTGGGLWIKNDQGDFYLTTEKNMGVHSRHVVEKNEQLIVFLIKTQWVIDFVEYFHAPDVYPGAGLDKWHSELKNIWLIIPFFQKHDLLAFVVLTKPRMIRKIDWEEHDLLKTVGMQLANALALSQASDDLSRARQFEAYSRFSAFLVHDLKNLVAQISLIVKNSEKHKSNPEFIDDSVETLKNVVTKIERLLGLLNKGSLPLHETSKIDIVKVLDEVKVQQAFNKPKVTINIGDEEYKIMGGKEKMVAILGHLVQNAQEATDDTGFVRIEVEKKDQQVVVKIKDSGCGMDEKFIYQRLFKPFDTTKGNAGMGIGVYEAREYIMQQSGKIDVESVPGQGTIFTISFPLAK